MYNKKDIKKLNLITVYLFFYKINSTLLISSLKYGDFLNIMSVIKVCIIKKILKN